MGHRGVELHVQGKPVRLHIAPGLTLADGPLNQVRHHTILAHGLSVQAVRAAGRAGTKVGPAENMPTRFRWSTRRNMSKPRRRPPGI